MRRCRKTKFKPVAVISTRSARSYCRSADGHRALFSDVSWSEYQHLMELRDGQRPRIRLTYDSGRLEIMSTSYRHERWKKMLARIFEMITMGRGTAISSAGNMTIEREDLQKGFEPDECYYTTNLELLKGVTTIDFATGPVPDLAIEAEHSRNMIHRLPLYAAMAIREIWRCDRGRFILMILDGSEYREAQSSTVLPGIPASQIVEYLDKLEPQNENAVCLELLSRVQKEFPLSQ